MAVDLHRMQIIKACDHDEFCSCSHTYPNGSHSTGHNLLGGKTLQVNTLYSEHVYLTEQRGFLVTVELYCDHFHYVLTYVDETLPVLFIVTINMCETVV